MTRNDGTPLENDNKDEILTTSLRYAQDDKCMAQNNNKDNEQNII